MTYNEILDIKSQYDMELREECNRLMSSGDEQKIQEGFEVQSARGSLCEFMCRLKVFARTKEQKNKQQQEEWSEEWAVLLLPVLDRMGFTDCSRASLRVFMRGGFSVEDVTSAFQAVKGWANFDDLVAPTVAALNLLRNPEMTKRGFFEEDTQ